MMRIKDVISFLFHIMPYNMDAEDTFQASYTTPLFEHSMLLKKDILNWTHIPVT